MPRVSNVLVRLLAVAVNCKAYTLCWILGCLQSYVRIKRKPCSLCGIVVSERFLCLTLGVLARVCFVWSFSHGLEGPSAYRLHSRG
jgi:hypothetical protein